jgi:hypothetical protein
MHQTRLGLDGKRRKVYLIVCSLVWLATAEPRDRRGTRGVATRQCDGSDAFGLSPWTAQSAPGPCPSNPNRQ